MTDTSSTQGKVLSQREIAVFFFPLLLNVQMMTVSHTLINAALARQKEFIVALAAYSVAWSIQQFFGSTNYILQKFCSFLVKDAHHIGSVV